MKGLTEKQNSILGFVEDHLAGQGYPPTIREIGDRFYITAKGAYDHLRALERKGYIRCAKNRRRAIEIVNPRRPKASSATIPLIGRVAAGLPLLAEENIEGYLSFPGNLVSGERQFALRVSGDSMKDAGILDNDIAIIQSQETANNGDIVVALINDEATLKYFYREANGVRLQPANETYKPLYSRQVAVIGKLVGIYRDY